MKTLLTTAILASMALGASFAMAEDAPPPPGGPGGHHGPRMEKMWEKIDADKDGVITQAEHTAFTSAKFKEMDANGDGKVTKEEMQAHHKAKMEKWGKMGKRHCEGMDKPGETPKE